MPVSPSDPIIEYGEITADEFPLDEPNILLDSMSFDPKREKKTYKGPNKVTRIYRAQDPILEMSFSGIILTVAGLTDQHPGTLVDSLANYTSGGTVHGFDPDDGIMVYEDPQREGNNEDPGKCKFKVCQYPNIAPS